MEKLIEKYNMKIEYLENSYANNLKKARKNRSDANISKYEREMIADQLAHQRSALEAKILVYTDVINDLKKIK